MDFLREGQTRTKNASCRPKFPISFAKAEMSELNTKGGTNRFKVYITPPYILIYHLFVVPELR